MIVSVTELLIYINITLQNLLYEQKFRVRILRTLISTMRSEASPASWSVASSASPRLSTAIARNTFSKISEQYLGEGFHQSIN